MNGTPTPGTIVLWDDIEPRWGALQRPERILQTDDPFQGTEILAATEEDEGLWVAGYLAYEAGYAMQGLGYDGPLQGPAAWFGVYAPESVEWREGPMPEADADGQIFQASSDLDEHEYSRRIETIHEAIGRGDTYQVNFTDRLRFRWQGSVEGLANRLRRKQRVRYGALIRGDGFWVVSLSPELFFRKEGEIITTRPMKGTIRRGRTTGEDAILAEDLRCSAKDRAENVMIVDLLRNDLGRLARTGSVEVADLFAVERYRTLQQMTSTVRARISSGASVAALMAALFPCGSVTGAPKRRTMEIIRTLEPSPRGVYCGAIGFRSPENEMCFSVPIRTLWLWDDGTGVMGTGSGIVADSQASREHAESRLKTSFLIEDPPARFALFETLLWEGAYAFLEEHLARLVDSAAYWDWPVDVEAAREMLLEHAPESRAKVRLELSQDGAIRVKSRPLPPPGEAPLRLGISPAQVSSEDVFLFHKTTNRRLYDDELARARASGLDDVLFFNARDQLTEACIHNVFVETSAGELLTPPLECGLLPGIFRQWLLRSDARCREAILSRQDLIEARAVWLCNSVRGMRRACLVGQAVAQ